MTMEMKLEEQFEAGLAKGLEQGIKILFFDVHMAILEIAVKLSLPEERVQKIVEELKER